MKIKNWSEFSINESFSLSKELYDFISKNSIKWSEFTDSLMEVKDIKQVEIKRWTSIVDDKDHTINVELEDGVNYKFNYLLRISYTLKKKGKLEDFYKSQQDLNTISISIQEMIDRVSEIVELKSNKYTVEDFNGLIKYQFEIQFKSDINLQELKNSYDDYKKNSQFNTPEFNAGMKKITDYYLKRNIDPSEYLDTTDSEDYILVGFITDYDLYGIADYNIKTKKFSIDWGEIDGSIDYMNGIE